MQVRMLTEADGRAIASWRYPGRDATYDVGEIVTSDQGHWAVVRHGVVADGRAVRRGCPRRRVAKVVCTRGRDVRPESALDLRPRDTQFDNSQRDGQRGAEAL